MRVRIVGKAWFTPDNRLLKKGEHEVPDDWNIPSGVEEVEEEEAPKSKAAKAPAKAD